LSQRLKNIHFNLINSNLTLYLAISVFGWQERLNKERRFIAKYNKA